MDIVEQLAVAAAVSPFAFLLGANAVTVALLLAGRRDRAIAFADRLSPFTRPFRL